MLKIHLFLFSSECVKFKWNILFIAAVLKIMIHVDSDLKGTHSDRFFFYAQV